jgi:hypothetical protein
LTREPGEAQFVEPDVSRSKFDREISEFRALESEFRARGWFLLDATFPIVRVAMCAPQLEPAPVVTGVEFDYTNYDVKPPSVTFIQPFSGAPYLFSELPTQLKRSVSQAPGFLPPGVQFPPGAEVMMVGHQPLLQAHSGEEIPFLCIAGVREYHEHPAHSGDLWELHRESGAGRLVRLLEVVHRYGIEPISDYQIQLSMSVSGLLQNAVPE